MMKKYMNHLIAFLVFLSSGIALEAQEENRPFTFITGNAAITLLPEGQQRADTGRLSGVTDEMIAECLPDGGTYNSAVNAFMIEYEDETVLVDAGFGRNLFAHLEACDKKPEDIQTILMTHLHGDHIGGLLREGRKSFPNATLYISRAEHDYWTSDEAMQRVAENRRGGFVQARNVIEAYGENLRLFTPGSVEKPGDDLLPGIKAVEAYGHTPGHTAFLLENDGSRLLIWGDLTHAVSVQTAYPQVGYVADTDPVQSAESRRRLFKYAADNGNILIAGMHIEYPGMGEVKGTDRGNYAFSLLCPCEGIPR
ncbi:MAG: MBL fold metallo-hydrolase [Proteiniphilum sp.]|jgi:glyoxylase-like metal-dependent hydrolase (beta-lactamase superfamily II)|nr:MBL fold metallo-hydrolase [Proteiniphilum sp.]